MMDLSVVPYESSAGAGKYKECMRNHAAAMGGHAFDGCGEFMPAASDSLKCAACGCHRNFHRRAGAATYFLPHHGKPISPQPPPPPPPPHFAGFLPPPPLPYHAMAPPPPPWHADRSRAGSETPPRRESAAAEDELRGGSGGRKRYRTKFTPEQKEKMRAFAEKLGWRIQRHDDGALDRFCLEVGVKRHVLKVWMHNHKNHLASPTSVGAAGGGPVAGDGGDAAAAADVDVDGDGDGDGDYSDDSPPHSAAAAAAAVSSSPSPSPIRV